MFNLQELKKIVKDLERIAKNCDNDNLIIIDLAQGFNDRYIIIETQDGEQILLSMKEILEN